jgi:hypothetical protein
MGTFDLGRLKVERIIVHSIPRHFANATQTPSTPTLSEVESPLDQTVKNYFREKMAEALGTAAFGVELDSASTSPVPGWIRSQLGSNPADFVTTSQELAKHLHQAQTGINSEGLLVVSRVKIEGRAGFAVMKLEREQGTRVRPTKVNGHPTLSVDHIRDLMLTGKTRVFKVGLFAHQAGPSTPIDGLVCDKQKRQQTTVAYFFLERFLGCKLKDLPEVTTSRFFEAAQTFINEEVAEPETRARYQVALLGELNSNRPAVAPSAFAAANLDTADRAPFLQEVAAAGVGTAAFPKDTTLISPKLRKLQWSFASGINVLASPDRIGQELTLEDMADGRTRLEVTDQLNHVRGHN